jgi:hypothetical protein
MWRDGLEDATAAGAALRAEVGAKIKAAKIREFSTLGVVKGYHYSGSPIVVDDGSAPPAKDFRNYVPSAHPGCIAPHAWLDDRTSLYDRFSKRFTLLATSGSSPAVTGVEVLAPGATDLKSLYDAEYALIRPDQHVAWRGNQLPADFGSVLQRASGF